VVSVRPGDLLSLDLFGHRFSQSAEGSFFLVLSVIAYWIGACRVFGSIQYVPFFHCLSLGGVFGMEYGLP